MEDEQGQEADYEEQRGGYVAVFTKPAVKGRDDYYIAIVCQCSTYCQQQEFGADSQLQLIISQWCDGIKIKEDIKDVKISSDVRKQVRSAISLTNNHRTGSGLPEAPTHEQR